VKFVICYLSFVIYFREAGLGQCFPAEQNARAVEKHGTRNEKRETSPPPLRPQDAVYPQIDEMIVEPFRLAQDPFLF
jgi:hypothetical protein